MGDVVERYEAVRTAFAKFIQASPDEVAIVTSVSAGINGIASALNFHQRNKVVMGEFEFPTMGHVWLGQRIRGADFQFREKRKAIRFPQQITEKLIDGKAALIVPLTHVCFNKERISHSGQRHREDRTPCWRSGYAR